MASSPHLSAVAALLVVPMLSLTARAEPPSPRSAASAAPVPPSAPAAPPPDLVLFKNGGMMRGTINEMTPGDSVTIVSAGGITKKISMAEVNYAGPADRAPKPPSNENESAGEQRASQSSSDQEGTRPFITVQSKTVSFRFVSPEPGVTLLIKTGEAEAVGWLGTPTGISAVAYTPICTAPCLASLPAGSHQLALSKEKGRPVATPELTMLSERSTIEGAYQSRQGVRTAGWVIAIGGVATGLVLTLSGFKKNKIPCPPNDTYCVPRSSYDFSGVYIGLGVTALSSIVGMLMVRTPDAADVTVSPRRGD